MSTVSALNIESDDYVLDLCAAPGGKATQAYRLDKANIIHVPVGKVSFTEEQLNENFQTLINAIVKAKPAAAKGQYLKSVVIASTMGPGVKINTTSYV